MQSVKNKVKNTKSVEDLKVFLFAVSRPRVTPQFSFGSCSGSNNRAWVFGMQQ